MIYMLVIIILKDLIDLFYSIKYLKTHSSYTSMNFIIISLFFLVSKHNNFEYFEYYTYILFSSFIGISLFGFQIYYLLIKNKSFIYKIIIIFLGIIFISTLLAFIRFTKEEFSAIYNKNIVNSLFYFMLLIVITFLIIFTKLKHILNYIKNNKKQSLYLFILFILLLYFLLNPVFIILLSPLIFYYG